MAVKRFNLLVEDPEPVFEWLREHGLDHVVRKRVDKLASGWNVLVVLDDHVVSEAFRLRWTDNLITLENQMQRNFPKAWARYQAEQKPPESNKETT